MKEIKQAVVFGMVPKSANEGNMNNSKHYN